jgi:hypothetical protein
MIFADSSVGASKSFIAWSMRKRTFAMTAEYLVVVDISIYGLRRAQVSRRI